jgi:hypothetical protein
MSRWLAVPFWLKLPATCNNDVSFAVGVRGQLDFL